MKNLLFIITVMLFSLAFYAKAASTAPLISDVPDQVVAQNTGTGTNYFVVGDAETAFPELTVTAASSNTNLVPDAPANIILDGRNSQWTIRVVPVTDQTGEALITLTVADGEALTASSTFNVTVTAPNTAPSLTNLTGHQIVSPDRIPAPVEFAIGDLETAAEFLNVTATSSNTNLVPNVNITLGGSGTERTVQVAPVAGQCGAAVIRLRVTDPFGASAQDEFIFSVFDAASANNGFEQPYGIYVLDSLFGSQINGVSMRDANVSSNLFVDGYVLRTEWATLEPTNGVFDFTIISNILAKLPAGQKLSLILASGVLPAWLTAVPGVATYTAGSPGVTRPLPWDAVAQERFRQLLVALGDYVIDGMPLRDHPRLAAMNAWIPGLKSGIRDPDEIKIRDLPGYSRTNMQSGVLKHLANVTDNFSTVPVQIGFWTYVDNQDAAFGMTPWEQLRQAILSQHNGSDHPHVGFWMENLAANRSAADADPWIGLPNTGFTAPLYLSQTNTFIGYQVLGSWSRPFNAAHVDNNLNGSPEDGMDYGFNTFQCRYYEHYQADAEFMGYTAEFQRWHDFLHALPDPPLPLTFSSSQGGITLTASNSMIVNITLSATGGLEPYTWSVVSGALPDGITLSSSGVLSGSAAQSGLYAFSVQAADATGGTAVQEFTLTIAEAEPPASSVLARNSDGSITIIWPTLTGGWYQVEFSSDLVTWTVLGSSVQAAATSMSWTDDGTRTGAHPSSVAKRFYRVRDWGVFTVTVTNNNFTYTDAQRTVTGILVVPAGTAPFPAVVINHGTGGSAPGFSMQRADEMSPWGLVCIGATLTHTNGTGTELVNWGYSPENLARVNACLAVLATRGNVDMNRLAMWGHSRGAFTTIGCASVLGNRLRAVGFSAGGVLDDADLSEPSYPSVTEAGNITAPAMMFLGSTDPIVPPAHSLRLQTLLNNKGVLNNRVVYDTAGITPASNAHNIQQTHFYTDTTTGVLDQWHAWLITHNVLP